MLSIMTWITLALSTFISAISATIPKISVKGAKLFANGQQFFIKGVAYQGTPSDPLVDVAQCTADAELMQTIGTNSIRVYHVDPYIDHSGCMSVFASNGIYVWLDLDTFNTSIQQDAPLWTETQLVAFAEVMDAFQSYPNLAGFWIGNEIINTETGSSAAPYIKAAVADMKTYMTAKKYRTIPIGYSAADIASLRPALQNYLACSSDASQNIDFLGLNSYEWCGDSSYETSGYTNLQNMSADYDIPIFFSETGCNVAPPRTFTDQAAILGPEMDETWSGAIIYEWVQEVNDYGLVTYPNGGVTGAPTPIQPDFSNLAAQWATLTPSGVAEAAYTPTLAPPVCPPAAAGVWNINGEVALPTLGSSLVQAVAVSKPVVSPITPAAPTTTYLLTIAEKTGVATTTVAVAAAGTAGTNPAATTTAAGAGMRMGMCPAMAYLVAVGALVAFLV